MKYLLDTCAFLYALQAPGRLGKNAAGALMDESAEICVSPVSFMEIAIKMSIGKLAVSGMAVSEFPAACAEMDFSLIGLEAEDCGKLAALPFRGGHKDPFDRLLACQALRLRAALISVDRKMKDYAKDGLRVVW